MVSENTWRTIAGFVGAALVLGILFWVVGIDRILSEVRAANPLFVGGSLLAVLCWLLAWSLVLRTVLSSLGVSLSIPRSFVVFAGAMFANNITPFGQAGGEPITALLLSRTTDTEYERGLAAIASVDTINFVPSILFATIGLGYYATIVSLGSDLKAAATVVGTLAIGMPVIGLLVWRYRGSIRNHIIIRLSPIRGVLNAVPRISITQQALEHRIKGFFEAINRVGTSPQLLGIAIGFSAVGWFCHTIALWSALLALGKSVPLVTLLFIVPIGAIAGLTPLPGGLGGVESVLVGLLVSTGVEATTAASAVIIYRGFIYWIPTTLGGGVVTILR
ncbi:MAG: YbhN family protein [Halobacteriaceae archaeon]